MDSRYRKSVVGWLLCCFLFVMAGCSSSQLVVIWSDPSFQTPPLNKMLVISVGKNPVQRRIWEDAYSEELTNHSVAATPSYRLFPDAVPDTDQVVKIVQSNGFDGVLVNRRLPPETKAQYVAPYVTKEKDMSTYLNNERFVTYYRDIEHAGYVDSEKVDIRAIDVWTTKNDGQLIWSATSKTEEPNSVEAVRPEIVKLVISSLAHRNIIGSGR
jgi:hypothetical protein